MRILTISLFILILNQYILGQGANCAGAQPFCTENNAVFPASTSTTAQSGPNYGCLDSQPNPAWYYMQVSTGGNINIALSNSSNVDIDFICWGPFNTLGSACGGLTGGGTFSACNIFGTVPCGNIVDCSYSFSATEEINISGATAGQFYMILITNFSGMPTQIDASTITGTSTGSTNCAIVPVPPCIVNSFTTVTGPCQPSNTYSQSGTFQFNNAPTTGTATVTVNNGTGTFTQVFNAPFTNNTVYNYNITNIPANGAASTVSVVFSATPACNQSINYTATVGCNCPVNIGTFNVSQNGAPPAPGPLQLCFGDLLDITPAGGFIPPNEAFAPPGPVFDPGVGWAIYSCPPSVGVIPASGVNIGTDPCFIGIVSNSTLNEMNDMFWINAYPGVFTNNIVYFVPLSFYSLSTSTYSYVNTSVGCYEMGTPYPTQYIPQFTTSNTQNCGTQQVTASFVGGLPAVDGSNYTVVAGSLSPATGVFVTTTCTTGGTIVLGNIPVGTVYSFDVTDGNGCTVTVSGTMLGPPPVTITYPQTSYCTNNPNPSPTLIGGGAGTYSALPAGLSINAASGVINLTASTAGNYVVTFQATGGLCPPSDTYNLTVNAQPVVDAGPAQSICPGIQVTLSGSGANTYAWSGGITDGVAFTPLVTTNYTVTGTSPEGCTNTDNVVVTVSAPPVIGAGADVAICIGSNTNLSASGGASYTWSPSTGLSSTTISNPVASPIVTTNYTVTGTTAAGCINTDMVTVTVNALPIVSAGPDDEICLGDNTILSSSGAVSYVWSPAAGLSSTVVSSPTAAPLTTTTYTVTATDANACVNTDQVQLVVNALPMVNAGIDQIICAGTNTILTGSGANTYVWDNSVTNNVSFSPNATNVYVLTGTSVDGCVNTDNVTVTVESNPIPSFLANDLVGCDPLTVTFTNTSGGTNCEWTFGDGTTIIGCGPIIHTFNGVGCYDVTLETETANGCIGSTSINDYICVTPFPEANFNPNPGTVSELNPVSTMINSTTGATNYSWTFENIDNSTAFEPTHTFPTIPGSYPIQLIATTPFGCADTAEAIVVVFEELIYYVPNTFTPDGDEFNNTFQPVFVSGFDPFDYNLSIFNRWGEVLFESNNAKIGWDGTYKDEFAADGVYIWRIEFKTKKNDARKTATGHITILR